MRSSRSAAKRAPKSSASTSARHRPPSASPAKPPPARSAARDAQRPAHAGVGDVEEAVLVVHRYAYRPLQLVLADGSFQFPIGAEHVHLVLPRIHHEDAVGVVHHVQIGQDVAVIADDKTRAKGRHFVPSRSLRRKAVKELIKRIVFRDVGHAGSRLGTVTWLCRADIDHCRPLLFHQVREIRQFPGCCKLRHKTNQSNDEQFLQHIFTS